MVHEVAKVKVSTSGGRGRLSAPVTDRSVLGARANWRLLLGRDVGSGFLEDIVSAAEILHGESASGLTSLVAAFLGGCLLSLAIGDPLCFSKTVRHDGC